MRSAAFRMRACTSCSSAAGPMPASSTRSPSRRRAPIARRRTARPSASSARCSSAGPTPTPTSTNQSVWLLWVRHSTSTIASVLIARLEGSRRCSASTTSLGHTTSRIDIGRRLIRKPCERCRLPHPGHCARGQKMWQRRPAIPTSPCSSRMYATAPQRLHLDSAILHRLAHHSAPMVRGRVQAGWHGREQVSARSPSCRPVPVRVSTCSEFPCK